MSNNDITVLSVRPASQVDLSPQTFEQALTFSNYLAESDLVPKDFKGKPGNCLIAMQWGAELGLKPLQALSNIAVINGRAALWGDAVIALVRSSPLCEYVQESDDGKTATCRAKRRGEPEQVVTFSMDDAKTAGLLGKQGPWTQYPKRMRQMRARAFALRDVFPDVLRGMPVAEEVLDTPKDMGAADVVRPEGQPKDEPKSRPTWPDEKFAAQVPRWSKAVANGIKTAEEIIAWASGAGALTPEQEKTIRAFEAAPSGVSDAQIKGEATTPLTRATTTDEPAMTAAEQQAHDAFVAEMGED